MNRLFNLDALIKNSGLPKAKLRALLNESRKEFPNDELLRELHVVRAIMYEKGLRREVVTARA